MKAILSKYLATSEPFTGANLLMIEIIDKLVMTNESAPLCVKIRVVHLDVEVRSEELLRQLSYAIKNQLGSLLAPRWFFMA